MILWRKVDQKLGKVNRHLRQSYDANFKIMMINAAEAPNNCQPAKKYGVTECNVRRWQVQKNRLKTLTASKRLTGGCVSLLLRNEFWLSESFSED